MMIWALARKTLRDHAKSTYAWSAGLLAISAIELYIYPTVVKSGEGMKQYLDAFPEAVKSMFRMEDYTSGAGFLSTELFSMMVPLIFISVAASRGANATAGEEERGTADLLFSLPIHRTSIVLSKLVALAIELVLMASALVLVLTFGSSLVNLKMNLVYMILATMNCLLLGFLFGGISLFAGTLTGKRGAAVGLTICLALAAFLFYSLAPMVETFDFLTPLNPFEWSIGGSPLAHGVKALSVIKLIGSCGFFYILAIRIFRGRDILT